MAKLKNLRINNFKFFGNGNEIPPIDGKHLLVYGENGSGKSTLYYALYTLLEAASKVKDEDIQKYFKKGVGEKDSLVNIHATQTAQGDFNSFVDAELDNGRNYRISFHQSEIRRDTQAQLSNVVTDFINYQLLYKFHDFRHSQEINLFPLFKDYVLPYVDFKPIVTRMATSQTETRASKLLEFIWKGPGSTTNLKGDVILAQKHSDQFKKWLSKQQSFNDDLRSLLIHINVEGKKILKKLGYHNFEFQLEMDGEVGIDKKDKRFYRLAPVITLKIPQYNGIAGFTHKPHTFLNEARFSALALAVRLAVLERNYNPDAELKMLVLDDLLLSLDMTNRDKVLDLLLNEYVKKYQIVLLTHEYRFFEITKKRIETVGQKDGWLFWEMYTAESPGIPPRPKILQSESYFSKARKHFAEFDYPASGNSLRKEAERFVKRFLPQRKKQTKTFGSLDLNGMINKTIDFARENGLSQATQKALKALDEHRKFIFNPLSHDSFDVSALKNDLSRAFETLEFLDAIESKTILQFGDKLHFELKDVSGDTHQFELELCDELKVIREKQQGTTPIVAKCPFYSKYSKNGVAVNTPIQNHQDLKAFFESKYQKSDKAADPDYLNSILLSDGLPLVSIA